MLHPPRGSPAPGGSFISKLENEGKPDQPREREDRQPHRVCHCSDAFGGGLYCSTRGRSAAARIVVLIIIVLLVVVRMTPQHINDHPQRLWVRGAQSRRQPRPSACPSTIGHRERLWDRGARSRPAHLRNFPPKIGSGQFQGSFGECSVCPKNDAWRDWGLIV